ncbi:MAG: O-antigen ligase family protein [Rhodoglobus sp.]
MRIIESPGARTAFLVLTLFTLMAGDAWRYTIGWTGFAILVGLLAVLSVVLLAVQRDRWKAGLLPYPLIAFLVLTVLSLVWSHYPGATALGLAATWCTVIGGVAVAVTFNWAEILRGLGLALKFVLGMSLLFEVVVAAFIRRPVLPPVPEPGIDYANLPDKIPPMLFWSRNELFQVFDAGKIQGIVGNSTLLSFVALLGLIVFGIQLAGGVVRKRWGLFWLAIAVANLAFSRSATNLIGLVAVIAVVAAVLLVRRATSPRAVVATYVGLSLVAVGGIVGALVFRAPLLGLLGKSSDLTNRTQIWNDVSTLAQQRPVLGWGWVSYWVPWVAPFDTLAENNGVRQLHAHNAWIDVWFQLGIVGLIVFGVLVVSTLSRSWLFAVDRPQFSPSVTGNFTPASMLPLLLLVALIVQSFAESRLLVEYGLFTLALLAVKTQRPQWGPR